MEQPQPPRSIKNVAIPMADGVNLAADLLIPGGAPVPVLINAYPYHKDDFITAYMAYERAYFAAAGYATVTVDLRGTGASEGEPLELWHAGAASKDYYQIIEWITQQDWCDGNVGMWGTSYGGIASFQAAAQQHPALKAIASIFGSVDGYSDFFYPGGCRNAMGMATFHSLVLAMHHLPPSEQDAEGSWKDLWLDRLASHDPFGMAWIEHPLRDEFWRDGAVRADQIEIPTLLVGGWRDIFPEMTMQVFQELRGPKQLIQGPWAHLSPHMSPVEPVDEVLMLRKWFDRWLKGQVEEPGGRESEALYYVQGAQEWRRDSVWPPQGTEVRTLFGTEDGALAIEPTLGDAWRTYVSDPTVGAQAGFWPVFPGLGAPGDQASDEARSLTFTTDVLTEDLEIAGSVEVLVHVAVEGASQTPLVAKVSEVSTNGRSELITTGWLEASHEEGHEATQPLGEVHLHRIRAQATSWVVKAGSRLRLSLSCSDFPHVFPGKTTATLRVGTGAQHSVRLELPVLPSEAPREAIEVPRPTAPIFEMMPMVRDAGSTWSVSRNMITDAVDVGVQGTMAFATSRLGLYRQRIDGCAHVDPQRPDRARVDFTSTFEVDDPGADAFVVQTQSTHWSDGYAFTATVRVNGAVVHERRWSR